MGRDKDNGDAGLARTLSERCPRLISVFLIGIISGKEGSSFGIIFATDAG